MRTSTSPGPKAPLESLFYGQSPCLPSDRSFWGGGRGGRQDTVVKMETAVFLIACSFEETKTIWKSMRSFKNSKSHPEDKHY